MDLEKKRGLQLLAACLIYMLIIVLFFWLLPLKEAHLFTTDSELTPENLWNWDVVETSGIDFNGTYYLVAESPDLRLPVECGIPYVLIRASVAFKFLTGYAYYKYGILYIFELNELNVDGHFEQVKVIARKKNVIDYFLQPYLDRLPEDKKRQRI